MKKKSQSKITSIGIMLLLTAFIAIPFSCKKMDDFSNRDEKKLPYGPYVPAALLQSMEYNIVKINTDYMYQLQQNLNADCFSQYMCAPTPFAGNQNNINYHFVDGWNDLIPTLFNGSIMDPWLSIKIATKDKNTDLDLYSVSLIVKVMAASRVTDVFGPIPYINYGQGTNVAFDCQPALYNQFFSELKTAIDQLTDVENATPNLDAKWAIFDKSNLGGDYKKWVQLANTLRLRLAIRISGVDAAKAKTEAEAAASHPFGLLETMPFLMLGGTTNPLWTMSVSWGDIRLGAPMGSLLNGYKDPRAAKYALPAKDTIKAIAGKIIGIRQGIVITDKATYLDYSGLNFQTADPVQLMSQSESFFLRAEGALNGWNMKGGSAQTYYENGVAASFTEHGLSGAADYLADAVNNKAEAYVDPHNAANNIPLGDPRLSIIPKQWSNNAADHLEQIITQKWIALFPDGQEAWSEHRRTGFPRLWPVMVNNSGNTIPTWKASDGVPTTEFFVKRLPYTSSFKISSQFNSAVTCLGGTDNGHTKLWWAK